MARQRKYIYETLCSKTETSWKLKKKINMYRFQKSSTFLSRNEKFKGHNKRAKIKKLKWKVRQPKRDKKITKKKKAIPLGSCFLVISRLRLPFSFMYWLKRLHVCAKLDFSCALLCFNMFVWLEKFQLYYSHHKTMKDNIVWLMFFLERLWFGKLNPNTQRVL